MSNKLIEDKSVFNVSELFEIKTCKSDKLEDYENNKIMNKKLVSVISNSKQSNGFETLTSNYDDNHVIRTVPCISIGAFGSAGLQTEEFIGLKAATGVHVLIPKSSMRISELLYYVSQLNILFRKNSFNRNRAVNIERLSVLKLRKFVNEEFISNVVNKVLQRLDRIKILIKRFLEYDNSDSLMGGVKESSKSRYNKSFTELFVKIPTSAHNSENYKICGDINLLAEGKDNNMLDKRVKSFEDDKIVAPNPYNIAISRNFGHSTLQLDKFIAAPDKVRVFELVNSKNFCENIYYIACINLINRHTHIFHYSRKVTMNRLSRLFLPVYSKNIEEKFMNITKTNLIIRLENIKNKIHGLTTTF